MKNIGCVIYTKTETGIDATWVFCKDDTIIKGTGKGERLTTQVGNAKFEGAYSITYFDEDGTASPALHLIISFNSPCYTLQWTNSAGEITNIGIGIELDDKLSVGWLEMN